MWGPMVSRGRQQTHEQGSGASRLPLGLRPGSSCPSQGFPERVFGVTDVLCSWPLKVHCVPVLLQENKSLSPPHKSTAPPGSSQLGLRYASGYAKLGFSSSSLEHPSFPRYCLRSLEPGQVWWTHL